MVARDGTQAGLCGKVLISTFCFRKGLRKEEEGGKFSLVPALKFWIRVVVLKKYTLCTTIRGS